MTRRKKDPLRLLTEEEQNWLERIGRSQREPASHVARAKEILVVADGYSYTQAAQIPRMSHITVRTCFYHAMLPPMLNPHAPLKMRVMHHCPLIQHTANNVEHNTRHGKPQ